MNNPFDNIEDMSLDGGSRSSRWKNLRGYLKQLGQIVDENSDRLATIETKAARIREDNLRIAKVIQALSDLANEEVQREVSLTLNDTDFDVVVDNDTPAYSQPHTISEAEERTDAFTIEEFLKMIDGAPGIGEKRINAISEYLGVDPRSEYQPSLDFEDKEGEIHG